MHLLTPEAPLRLKWLLAVLLFITIFINTVRHTSAIVPTSLRLQPWKKSSNTLLTRTIPGRGVRYPGTRVGDTQYPLGFFLNCEISDSSVFMTSSTTI